MESSLWCFSFLSRSTCWSILQAPCKTLSWRNMKTLSLVLWTLCLLVPLAALAQPPAHIISPKVQQDGHVTFRFSAPNAAKVELHLEGAPDPTPMQKHELGLWTVTIGPLQPDIY